MEPDEDDQGAIEAARLLSRARWLNRARIDPSVTPSAFRVAATIAAITGAGGVLRIIPIKLAFLSATSKPTLNLSLDRLAARRLISLNRKGRGGSVEIRIPPLNEKLPSRSGSISADKEPPL